MGGKILAMAQAGMVGMAMGDQRAVNRAPRINIKIPLRAVDATIRKDEQW